jgi:hypothetical protein
VQLRDHRNLGKSATDRAARAENIILAIADREPAAFHDQLARQPIMMAVRCMRAPLALTRSRLAPRLGLSRTRERRPLRR